MAIRYKVDIIAALRAAGYTSYRLRKERIIGEAALQKLRSGGLPSWKELNTVCGLLHLQPGDLIEYCEDETTPSDG